MQQYELRLRIHWNPEYRPEWDIDPDKYADSGIVQWGRSRRLGKLQLSDIKAYIGVQHVDPNKPGWAIVDQPQARFFASVFISGQCIALRTFPSMQAALDMLLSVLPHDAPP